VIELRLLGPLEVLRDGVPVPLGGARQRSTLAILLLNGGRVVPVERLADDLYAGAAPATAVTQVQRQVSELRRLLPDVRLETSSPGYVLRFERGQLDLERFEHLVADGIESVERGDAADARGQLRDALDLWRGPPLADLADEPFAKSAAERLEELRLAALERLFDAELDLGRGAAVVPELEALVAENPFRERLVAQLMVALYRAERQADALAAYRAHRLLFSQELGLEPSPSLRQLETAILQHDPLLLLQSTVVPAKPPAPVVVAAAVEHTPSPTFVELASAEPQETILLQLVTDQTVLGAASAAVEAASAGRPQVRAAAFVTSNWQEDVARFASLHEAALVLVEGALEPLPILLFERSIADVGLLVRGRAGDGGSGVLVAFGGNDHDWAALEIGAAVARGTDQPLVLVGAGSPPNGRRDASRLLADASLAVQRLFGIASRPLLAPATPDALVAVVDDAKLVVAGIGSRWRSEGLGAVRSALANDARPPLVLVHRGPRPGILAPRESRTRFSWSLQD
jgi:DNA-binding SARP family transcriptional activator